MAVLFYFPALIGLNMVYSYSSQNALLTGTIFFGSVRLGCSGWMYGSAGRNWCHGREEDGYKGS
jgi:hypothetical protein